ncbi:MAG: hypothetical protein NTW16_17785 [Bacteroidetes bacterium]|nr:hypothetical protein [Bacteroidota bacterium]
MENKLNALIVCCGLFSYKDGEKAVLFPETTYNDFEDLFEKDPGIKILRQIFYPNFTSLIVSKNCHKQDHPCTSLFQHLRLTDVSGFKNLILTSDKEESVKFSIAKVDIFLFPEIISESYREKLGIYAFHIHLADENAGFETISSFIHRIRLFESNNRIRKDETDFTTIDFIQQKILSNRISLDLIANITGNKLKVFTVINSASEIDDINKSLLDIGTAQHITAKSREHSTKGSEELYHELLKSNTISIYSNWKALAAFDSFTVIGTELNNIETTWGTTYLLIYIQCVKMKFYLFHVNSALSNISFFEKYSEKLRTNFTKFINSNNLFAISFNILPNKIYHAIKNSLEIDEEVEELEKKIIKIGRIINEKNDKNLNKLIFLLALLGVVSVIFHASEFIMKVFSISEHYYPHLGLTIAGTVVLAVSAYFLLLRKRG